MQSSGEQVCSSDDCISHETLSYEQQQQQKKKPSVSFWICYCDKLQPCCWALSMERLPLLPYKIAINSGIRHDDRLWWETLSDGNSESPVCWYCAQALRVEHRLWWDFTCYCTLWCHDKNYVSCLRFSWGTSDDLLMKKMAEMLAFLVPLLVPYRAAWITQFKPPISMILVLVVCGSEPVSFSYQLSQSLIWNDHTSRRPLTPKGIPRKKYITHFQILSVVHQHIDMKMEMGFSSLQVRMAPSLMSFKWMGTLCKTLFWKTVATFFKWSVRLDRSTHTGIREWFSQARMA